MQLVKREDGSVINVIEAHTVERSELVDQIAKAEECVRVAKNDLAEFDELTNPPEPAPTPEAEPETPAEQAAEIAEDAAQLAQELTQPVVAVEGQPAPVAPEPTPQPVTPPAADTPPITVQ